MQSLELSNDELSSLGKIALHLALDYWSSVDQRPAFPSTSARQTLECFSCDWEEDGAGASVLEDFRTIAEHARPSGARFFGYIVGSGEPVSAFGDLLISALNQNVTAWRSAPAATVIEKSVIQWLADAVGCTGFSGSLCGGGSVANLMALAMAREAKLPANETGVQPCVVYTSEQAHMSIPKAIALLGIGRTNLKMIPVDKDMKMRVDLLEASIASDRKNGQLPIAIVATAGTVNIGAIDPLPELARLAQAEQLWLHIDGAYGGLAALASPEKFRGVDQADSVSLDAHKWLYQPLDCGCLLYRDPGIARQTFSFSGDYVKTLDAGPVEGFAFFEESIELSRRFRALKLWMSLRYHGKAAFRDAIASDLEHAKHLASNIEADPDLELAAPVNLSAVCFRHRRKDNLALLKRVLARGRVYLSNASIDDQFVLRACFVNHRTTMEDVREIVSEVKAAADELEG
ncbi:pyridoxal phosphate-dependent decarboxylase family protein [Ruegeria sp. SCP11]|uniref:pyridoxal phosphate-dependent decarboxylase family protein n=1 Tax=Ruegeria sp. SCP11 TaxID=3141378 RepID=UPI00333C1410